MKVIQHSEQTLVYLCICIYLISAPVQCDTEGTKPPAGREQRLQLLHMAVIPGIDAP